MHHDRVTAVLKETFEKAIYLRETKGREYSGTVDALENFKRNARDTCSDPILVWRIYAGKHWDSINTYVQDINKGITRETVEPIDGRIDDLIVYLILLKCLNEDKGVPQKS